MKKIDYKINVAKPTLPNREVFDRYINRIWESNWLTNNGPLHTEFENKLKERLTVENASLFTNGHLGLEITLKTLPRNGEVITTPFTFASTIHAIVASGLTPVFCDIEPTNYCIDPNQIESLINNKTVAILPVHVFGYPCDVQRIDEIARKHKLQVIYDAAHAFGVRINGIGIGNFGDVSMFSLHSTKVFHSIEGGVLTYRDFEMKPTFDMMKNFGIFSEDSVKLVGMNAKMNEFQAAMGLANLDLFDEQVSNRKKITDRYRENLGELRGIRYQKDLEGIHHNYSYFPVLIDKNIFGKSRDEVYIELKEYNIFARKYFYPLCSDFECYHFDSNLHPKAKLISEQVLCLPIYSDLTLEEVDYICRCINEISKNTNLN